MIRVRQVKVSISNNNIENILKQTANKLKIASSCIKNIIIIKQSLDARKKEDIHYSYEVDIEVNNEEEILLNNKSNDIFISPIEEYHFPESGINKLDSRPIIVGSGPAGIFAAYLLAENGYKPIVIERGEKIEDRVKTVSEFWDTGKLNTESNVQFGEGGAGTFSDGKLNTLVKDKEYRGKKVFEILIENGAPSDILYLQHPHIGTDLLRNIMQNIRNNIIKMGGEFYFNTKLTNLIIENNKINSIEVNNEEKIKCDALVLAIGHSARDTFNMLYSNNIKMSSKPFAVGVRIEHPQKMINLAQYGHEDNKFLPTADYKLTYKASNNRGVYSFCMCPGGFVVNASSCTNKLAINGMSNYKRDEENANSALIVTITPEDFGYHPLDGIRYQENLEELAYKVGNGKIPVQLWKDFKDNKISTSFGEVKAIFKGSYEFANLNNILPNYVIESLKEAIPYFNSKIKGYSRDDAIIAAIESRTSSPIRIERDESMQSSILGLYPCGEGAGYAGGITTSAMDGIKVAEQIAKNYGKINE